MSDFICGKCKRVLKYSLLKNIACWLLGGHESECVGRHHEESYFGVKREIEDYACRRCGSQWSID